MVAVKNFRVDSFVASLAIKAPCKVVTNTNLTLSGEQSVNGTAVTAGDRVLVKDQTDPIENGIYNVETSAWARAADFDGNRDVVRGTLVTIPATTGQDFFYQVTSSDPITIGTSAITFLLTNDPNVSHPITQLEITSGLTAGDITDSFEPGDVRRYGAVLDNSTDDHDAFQDAIDSGHKVWIPYTATGCRINSTLTLRSGLSMVGESLAMALNYHGVAATYLFDADEALITEGIHLDNFGIAPGVTGTNGIKFIECRAIHIPRLLIDGSSGGNKFAIGILVDDDGASAPQIGSAWNRFGFIITRYCTDAHIRLDTQGALPWANRQLVEYHYPEGGGIGMDVVSGATNDIRCDPQTCTTGVHLAADADNNVIRGFEEGCTNSITIDANAVQNEIRGNWDFATATDNGSETRWFTQDQVRSFAITDGSLRFEQTSGNVSVQIPTGFTGNMNFLVTDNQGTPVATQVLSFVGGVADPYITGANVRATAFFEVPSYTAAQLGDVANAVNTSDNKRAGVVVRDSDSNRLKIATGAADASTWIDVEAGTNVITPS